MAAAINFNALGFTINAATGDTLDIPIGHPFCTSIFGMAGVPNAAAGIKTFHMCVLVGLGLALSIRVANNPAEFDALYYALNGIDLQPIFSALATAANAGFTHNVVSGRRSRRR